MTTIYTKDNFNENVLSKGVALIDFFATWCGPCQMLAPTIDELTKEFEGKAVVGKVDVDESPELASKYGVMSIPTLILFKDGKEVSRLMGTQTKATLTKLINEAF